MMNPLPNRFLKKVNITETCWLWVKGKDSHGYGRLIDKGKYIGTHRYAWMCNYGEIPKGMCVLHKCDVPACVNPDHLFLGTHKENMDDKVSKGRQPKGETNGRSKLTQEDVNKIRGLYQKGIRCCENEFSCTKLAIRFRVSKAQISHIVNNKSWTENILVR